MFLAEMSNYLKLVCVQGANSKHLLLKLNLRNSGKHLCKSNSLELSQVNTPRTRSILVNCDVTSHTDLAPEAREKGNCKLCMKSDSFMAGDDVAKNVLRPVAQIHSSCLCVTE